MTSPIAAPSTDPVAAPETVTDAQVNHYHEEGYLVLPGLLSPGEAAALQTEVKEIMAVIGLGTTKLRQSHEYRHDSHLDSFVNSPRLCALAGRLMGGGEATLYLPFTAVKSGADSPGETGGGQFHYHQDNQYTRFDGPGINLWFALSPMTEENGCLKIVPRSHLNGTLPAHSPDGDGHKAVTFEPESFVPVLMAPGDCVAFSRLTVHGSGVNRTPDHRWAYAVQFALSTINYSTDSGETFVSLRENPRWSTGPVSHITPPKGKLDGH